MNFRQVKRNKSNYYQFNSSVDSSGERLFRCPCCRENLSNRGEIQPPINKIQKSQLTIQWIEEKMKEKKVKELYPEVYKIRQQQEQYWKQEIKLLEKELQ